MHTGPNIERDGLVFGYDTGYGVFNQRDQLRFFKGGPIDNIWSDSYGQSVNDVSSWSAPMQSTAGLTQSVRSETWNGNRIWQLERTAGNAGIYDSWRRCVDQPLAGSYPSTRFVTMKICTPFDDPVSELALHTGGGNSSHDSSKFTKIPINEVPKDAPYRDKWYEFHISADWSSTSVGHCVGLAFRSGNASTFLATEPMYYASTHKIPFTPTDRSSTQSLIDLTRTTTIDVSNVSFDSTGQPTFDGTDDEITIPYSDAINTNSFTVECVAKLTTADNTHKTVICRNSDVYGSYTNGWHIGTLRDGLGDGNNDWRVMFYGDSTYVDLSDVAGGVDGNYHHIAAGCDGTNVFLYVDGSLINSTSKPSGNLYTPTIDIHIARNRTGNDHWAGDIPVAKYYNRAISADEVQQNYRAYKNRFDL
jgi:hypothetical protein